jgi:23S rRNA (uracil1939-C5)-methyltransferase
LGARGDGIAAWNEGSLFVPFSLPGETVRACPGPKRADGVAARLEEVLTPAPERVEASCPLFMSCGGCTMQHLDRTAELAWKRDSVVEALTHRGYDDAERLVAAPVAIPAASRRRASLSYRQLRDRFVLGFNARASHQIIPLDHCPLVTPSLNSVLSRLSTALHGWVPVGAQGDLTMTDSDSGLDLVLDLPEAPDMAAYQGLAQVAEDLDLARLSLRINGEVEPLAQRRQPVVHFGGIAVSLPPAAFLQPSREGEQALQKLVLEGLEGIKGPVADLFCGVGTFALAIAAQGHAVSAYDHLALQTGPLRSTGRVSAQQRDLFRQPLLNTELAHFTALVIDPPRAGAKEQCEEMRLLAEGTKLQRIVMVSCNPATFARDCRLLEDAGFALQKITPVDQFIWSAHLEVVALFDRMR